MIEIGPNRDSWQKPARAHSAHRRLDRDGTFWAGGFRSRAGGLQKNPAVLDGVKTESDVGETPLDWIMPRFGFLRSIRTPPGMSPLTTIASFKSSKVKRTLSESPARRSPKLNDVVS
jgi:hypothetical protein